MIEEAQNSVIMESY
jgi:hypothetical protein